MSEDFKTPTELLEMFPECGYNVREIGYLLMLGVVKGEKIRNGCLVSVESFSQLLAFREIYGKKPYKLRKNAIAYN